MLVTYFICWAGRGAGVLLLVIFLWWIDCRTCFLFFAHTFGYSRFEMCLGTFLVGISFVFWMPRGRRSGSPDDSLRWILLYKMSCYCHGYLCSGSFPLLFFVGFRTVLVSFRVILLFFVGFRTDLVSLNVLRVLLIWFVAWSLPHIITRALALSRLQRNQFQTGSRP